MIEWAATLMIVSLTLASSSAVQVQITTNQPQGVTFSIPDEGYSLVGLHYNVNKPLADVAAGDVSVDLLPTGSDFTYKDPNIKPGDVINYWVLSVDKTTGEGKQLVGQTFTVTAPTAATTTTTAATTTSTSAPAITNVPDPVLSTLLAQATSGTAKPATDTDSSATNTGTATGTGNSGTTNTGTGTGPATVTKVVAADPYNGESSCTSYPCLIFEDDFNTLDTKLWEHEITAGGGGNWEFQYYLNNRSNSYVKDGKLFIRPTLTTDRFGPDFLEHGNLNLWGASPADTCTGNNFYGCERTGMPGQVLNPIQSARLRSSRFFNFKYGRLEVEAKMPKGDWLWPAIWLLPRWNAYGAWPASGEIDVVESRGNANYKDDKGQSAGVDSVGSTLHFGPFVEANQWPKAHATTTAQSGTFADGFHKFQLDWDDKSIRFTVDGKEILNVDPGAGGFWQFGDFEKTGQGKWDNPWVAGTHMAPFDQEFYIIMNVAVGGVGFFPDNYVNSPYPKPWNDHAGHAATAFWNARGSWLPTWKLDQDNGEGVAMQVESVRVWKMGPTP